MRLTGEVLEMLRNHYKHQVLDTEIKVNVKLAEASSFGQSIFEYDERCPGAKLYRKVMQELEARCLALAAVA
jgi:chromosome partitioning protein